MADLRPERLIAAREHAGLSQAELARLAGVGQSTIARLEGGETRSPRNVFALAKALATTPAYLLGETDDPSAGALPQPVLKVADLDDGTVPVRQLDLAFGMGATFLDIPVTEKIWRFPRDWLRQYTLAPADQLMFAQGAGDSMFPTLLDSDTLLIDCSNQIMTMADQIWAISYCGMGMIKRLRPSKDGGMRIMSDNPNVREETAYDNEMQLIGRVVGIFRKM